MKQKFVYYENGHEEVFTFNELKKLFKNEVDERQKSQGTTFDTWLDEMLKMQILIRL